MPPALQEDPLRTRAQKNSSLPRNMATCATRHALNRLREDGGPLVLFTPSSVHLETLCCDSIGTEQNWKQALLPSLCTWTIFSAFDKAQI